ncbi:MBL fold metallo-hydrolase [Jatrophihabitans sp. YIM 134969]
MSALLGVTEVADDVWFARGRDVNWTLLVEGSAVTLVDAGYPGYAGAVRESLDAVGRSWGDVAAVLVTHGHVDHVGALPALLQDAEVPVYAGPGELANLHGERHESAGVGDVVKHLAGHGVLPWALRISRAGGSAKTTVRSATSYTTVTAWDDALDVPGRPVPVPTPGHTSGHTAYLIPSAGAVVTGDTLCTGHALSRVEGPQLLPPWFDHDRAGVVDQLDTLAALDADIVLPGHGPVLGATLAAAADAARLTA